MKEPNETIHMQQKINQIYGNRIKTKPKVPENYKNIDVLPSVYDTPVSTDIPTGKEKEGFKGGFKKTFKKIGKTIKNALTQPIGKWNAPYTGPPKKGPIEDIDYHDASNLNRLFLQGEDFFNYFTQNEKYLDNILDSKPKKKKFKLSDWTAPFRKCPQIKFTPITKFPFSLVSYLTDTVPCLINGYSELVVNLLQDESAPRRYRIHNKALLKQSIYEFLYVCVSFYLCIMVFYYVVINPEYLISPSQYMEELDNVPFVIEFVFGRVLRFLDFPVICFNAVLKMFIPGLAWLLGAKSNAKLYYLVVFLFVLGAVFNGNLKIFADMAKQASRLRAHSIIYMLISLAIFFYLFDLNNLEYIQNIAQMGGYIALGFAILLAILVGLCITVAMLLAPLVQLYFVFYLLYLFIGVPVFNLFSQFTDVLDYIVDPKNSGACGTRSGHFTEEFTRFLGVWVFPVFFKLVLLIFFLYQINLTSGLKGLVLPRMMVMINGLLVLVILAMIVVFGYNQKPLQDTVDMNNPLQPPEKPEFSNTSSNANTNANNLQESVQQSINTKGVIPSGDSNTVNELKTPVQDYLNQKDITDTKGLTDAIQKHVNQTEIIPSGISNPIESLVGPVQEYLGPVKENLDHELYPTTGIDKSSINR